MTGKLLGIAIRGASRAPIQFIVQADVRQGLGIVSDFRGTGGKDQKRQVTVLSAVSWMEVCGALGKRLNWGMRRANLHISDLVFGPDAVGKKLRIGSNVVLEITGECSLCSRMDEQFSGLKAALEPHWRGGVTCRVVAGGVIRFEDSVVLDD